MARSAFIRSLLVLGLFVAGLCLLPGYSPACPFCSMQGQTLMGDVGQATMVLYGTFANAQLNAGDDSGGGSTDLQIEAIIKNNEVLGNKKVITLPRYIPPDKNSKTKFLVFCDVFKGKIDPYRGVPVAADCDIVKYLKGAMEVQPKSIEARLRFYFDFLDDKEPEIATDAYKEFANADYKDYRGMAKQLPAEKIAAWLEDANTPKYRMGLYASMLGHCGKPQHAALLRTMLDDPRKRVSEGIDGIIAGYVMLDPKGGWDYTRALLKDSSKEFLQRYAALRAVRFLWESRPDLVSKNDLVEGVTCLLGQSDIADLAIEDLRKWGRWELCDQILDLQTKKSHDVPIIRRAILRFALSCPQGQAAAFVDKMRKRDPDSVKDAEELLKLETKTS
jgi:hypothetical protein